MKTIRLVFLLGLLALSSAATPVMFPLRDMTGSDQVRTITITPLDGPISYQGIIYPGDPITLQTVPNGATNSLGQPVSGAWTNYVGGNIRITFAGLPRAMQMYVPVGFTNFVSAADPQYWRTGLIQVFNLTNDASGQIVKRGTNVTVTTIGNESTVSADVSHAEVQASVAGIPGQIAAAVGGLSAQITASTSGIPAQIDAATTGRSMLTNGHVPAVNFKGPMVINPNLGTPGIGLDVEAGSGFDALRVRDRLGVVQDWFDQDGRFHADGGFLTGLNPSALQQNGASFGQALTWNGSIWTPATVTGGGGGGGGGAPIAAGTNVVTYSSDGTNIVVNAAVSHGEVSGATNGLNTAIQAQVSPNLARFRAAPTYSDMLDPNGNPIIDGATNVSARRIYDPSGQVGVQVSTTATTFAKLVAGNGGGLSNVTAVVAGTATNTSAGIPINTMTVGNSVNLWKMGAINSQLLTRDTTVKPVTVIAFGDSTTEYPRSPITVLADTLASSYGYQETDFLDQGNNVWWNWTMAGGTTAPNADTNFFSWYFSIPATGTLLLTNLYSPTGVGLLQGVEVFYVVTPGGGIFKLRSDRSGAFADEAAINTQGSSYDFRSTNVIFTAGNVASCRLQFVGVSGTNVVPRPGFIRTLSKTNDKLKYLQLGQGGHGLTGFLSVNSNTMWTCFKVLSPDLFAYKTIQQPDSVPTTISNLNYLSFLVTNASPGCTMLFFGTPPVPVDVSQAYAPWNSIVQSYCQTNGHIFADLASSVADTNWLANNGGFTSNDGLHPTIQSYHAMLKSIFAQWGWKPADPSSQITRYDRVNIGGQAIADDHVRLQVSGSHSGGTLQVALSDGFPGVQLWANGTPSLDLGSEHFWSIRHGGEALSLNGSSVDGGIAPNGAYFIGPYNPATLAYNAGDLRVSNNVYASSFVADGPTNESWMPNLILTNLTPDTVVGTDSRNKLISFQAGTGITIGSGFIRATGAGTATNLTSATTSTSTDYALTANDYFLEVTASGRAITVPSSGAGAQDGREYIVKLTVPGTATLVATSLIDGSSTYTLSGQYDCVRIHSDGSMWRKVQPLATGGGGGSGSGFPLSGDGNGNQHGITNLSNLEVNGAEGSNYIGGSLNVHSNVTAQTFTGSGTALTGVGQLAGVNVWANNQEFQSGVQFDGAANSTSASGFAGAGQSLTNLNSTNIVSQISTLASASNSVPLNNGPWFFVASTAFSITNVSLTVAAQMRFADIIASNQLATAITGYCTIPGAKFVGQISTNALVIAAGKEGHYHIEARGVNEVNVFNCLQQ